ncbi:zinc ABC transporter substrate-binding protein [Candidatus Uhrbacteria bacterium]|nr:zinc ABC transporter substrate-binding protein [Candidatus Uhrbacteria bacterium]
MSKRLGIGVAIGIFVLVFVLLSARSLRNPIDDSDTTINVVASFYPLYYFASAIAGDDATVHNLTPAGVEPHEYELTPNDIVLLENAKLLLLNGAGLEPWANDVKSTLEGKGVVIVDTSGDVATVTTEADGTPLQDPHGWLSPVAAQAQVDRIVEGFAKADPLRASVYQQRASDLKVKLAALDRQYTQGLKQCNKRSFITSHNAFGYLARQYNLNQVAIAGFSPDEEPTAKALARVADLARYYQVRVIFFETLVSPKLSQTIAASVGAQTLPLNPIEGLSEAELAQGKDYVSEMQKNLESLRFALECR